MNIALLQGISVLCFVFLQMYSDAAVMDTFERDAVCVTADCE